MYLISELKRRNVFRVATAYVVTAWLLIQVAETLFPLFGFDDTPARIVVIILAIGFIPAVVFAWVFEFTPDGIKRDEEVDRTLPANAVATKRLDRGIIIILVLALGYFAFDKFVISPQREAAEAEQVAARVEQAIQQGRDQALAESLGEQSIAVLPFKDMSPARDQEYLSDGLADELLNLLAKIPQLRVTSRSSSFSFKGLQVSIPDIARRLNVTHLLEGSVRKTGNRVRITAQLIEGRSDTQLWSESFDRDLDDIFAIQDEIAQAVVDRLQLTLVGETPQARVVDTEALELTLRGRFLANRRNPGDLQSAFELFEQAIAIDPRVVNAWVGLAPLYIWLFDPPRIDDAENAVERAIELDPENPEAWVRRGTISHSRRNNDLASEYISRALEYGPDNPLALAVNASEREHSGNISGAVELLSRAVAVDPMNVVNQQYLVSMLITSDRFEDAAEALRRARELAPTSIILDTVEIRLELLQGNSVSALEKTTKLRESGQQASNPYQFSLVAMAMAHHDLGDAAASEEALERFRESTQGKPTLFEASIYAWRGETDKAFEVIDEARKDDFFPFLRGRLLSPEFKSLHDDPRWPKLMEDAGLKGQ